MEIASKRFLEILDILGNFWVDFLKDLEIWKLSLKLEILF
jgi:hypothetical protein